MALDVPQRDVYADVASVHPNQPSHLPWIITLSTFDCFATTSSPIASTTLAVPASLKHEKQETFILRE
jgi:hypothetical protein